MTDASGGYAIPDPPVGMNIVVTATGSGGTGMTTLTEVRACAIQPPTVITLIGATCL